MRTFLPVGAGRVLPCFAYAASGDSHSRGLGPAMGPAILEYRLQGPCEFASLYLSSVREVQWEVCKVYGSGRRALQKDLEALKHKETFQWLL